MLITRRKSLFLRSLAMLSSLGLTWSAVAQERSAFTLSLGDVQREEAVRALDAAEIHLRLHLGYDLVEDGAGWTTDLPGVRVSRSFERSGPGMPSRIELALSRSLGPGWDVHGVAEGGTTEPGALDSDLEAVRRLLDEALPGLREPSRESDDLASEILQLSYVQSDRAMAVLKAMGYSTIEFDQHEGDSIFDSTFSTRADGDGGLPRIIELVDPPKTSIMDPFVDPRVKQTSSTARRPAESSLVPNIGGVYLHDNSTGEPVERLLVVYDEDDPESLERVRRLIVEQIDRPARQVLIEAVLVEIEDGASRDLGLRWGFTDDDVGGDFGDPDPGGAGINPLRLFYEKGANALSSLRVELDALIVDGRAKILSRPSVFVLDGRQAKIQIGQQVPIVTSTAVQGAVSQRVEYFPVGLVLNLRPRISADGSEVTLQVETIVSGPRTDDFQLEEVLVAPIVISRQLQTIVRVANGNPLVIGGLVGTREVVEKQRVPGLSKIPGLGALFRRREKSSVRDELTVILIPHVLEEDRFPAPFEVGGADVELPSRKASGD